MEKTKDPKRVATGKKNRQSGAAWELKVRKDLESNSWIVVKWQNNVETKSKNGIAIAPEDYKLIPAKRKYNPFSRALAIGTGFPDFLAYKQIKSIIHNGKEIIDNPKLFDLIGIEAKSNGNLDKQEKEKCKWLLQNNIFSQILIAAKKKVGRRVVVEYIDFVERYL